MTASQIVQFGGYCVLIFSLIYFANSWTSLSEFSSLVVQRFAVETATSPPRKPIIIYVPSKFFSQEVNAEKFMRNCPTKDRCSISRISSDLARADAVVIHNRNFDMNQWEEEHKEVSTRITSRFAGTLIPSTCSGVWRVRRTISLCPDFINWTMTYRRDGYPYGRIERRNESITIDFEKIWSIKNQSLPPATWIGSHCITANGRDKIIAKLEEHGLEMDKWGRCGRSAPGCTGFGLHGDQCTTDLVAHYKFYLAFENSNCVDYVTEKFYMTMRSRMAVPIVLSRRLYEDLGIPSSAFIALSDYETAEDAVKEINTIAENKTAYLEYHQWREDYEVKSDHDDGNGFCELL